MFYTRSEKSFIRDRETRDLGLKPSSGLRAPDPPPSTTRAFIEYTLLGPLYKWPYIPANRSLGNRKKNTNTAICKLRGSSSNSLTYFMFLKSTLFWKWLFRCWMRHHAISVCFDQLFRIMLICKQVKYWQRKRYDQEPLKLISYVTFNVCGRPLKKWCL